jgi:hypothetical protein
MFRFWRFLSLIVLAALLVSAGGISAQAAPSPVPAAQESDSSPYPPPWEAHSTTGPVPPPEVEAQAVQLEPAGTVTLSVPDYDWTHGCGPTAAAIALAYWDANGFPLLFPGDGSLQLNANQRIASTGAGSNHYNDYALPRDDSEPSPLADCSSNPACTPHSDNSIADFMHTSRSVHGLQYGWSYYSYMRTAFLDYVNYVNSNYGSNYLASSDNLTLYSHNIDLMWSRYKAEIDAGRPVVLLVDTNSDGYTDHFVTGMGYSDTNGLRQYAVRDTWLYDGQPVRWNYFNAMASGASWGVYGLTTLSLASLDDLPYRAYLPMIKAPSPELRLASVKLYDYPNGNYQYDNHGNGDLKANPGEFIVMSPAIYNPTNILVEDITLELIINDPYINSQPIYQWFYKTYAWLYQVEPGNTESPYNGFRIAIAGNTPNGRVIPYTIRAWDENGNGWYFNSSLTVTGTDKTPPRVYSAYPQGYEASIGSPVRIQAYIMEASGVKSAKAFVRSTDGKVNATVTLNDSGTSGDIVANDRYFSGFWTPTTQADYMVDFQAVDNPGNTSIVYQEMAVFSSKVFAASANVLMVIDHSWSSDEHTYFTSALTANAFSYNLWDSYYRGAIRTSILDSYRGVGKAVIYSVPSYSKYLLKWDDEYDVRYAMRNFLDNGGRLFITGQDIGFYLAENQSDLSFFNDYLSAQYVQDDSNLYGIYGVASDPISNNLSFNISGSGGANNQSWPDEINPLGTAQSILYYQAGTGGELSELNISDEYLRLSGREQALEEEINQQSLSGAGIVSSGTAGLRYTKADGRKVVYLSFGFEAINDATNRATLMKRIVDWLMLP